MKAIELIPNYMLYLQNEKGSTDKTIVRYTNSIKKFIRDTGMIEVIEFNHKNINQEMIYKFWDQFVDVELSTSARSNYIASIKSFIKFLHQKGYIPEDFADSLSLPRPDEVFKDGLTNDEQKIIRTFLFEKLKTEAGRRNAALFTLLLATGMRIDEALVLRTGGNKTIEFLHNNICGHFEFFNNSIYVHVFGKRRKNRKVIIDPTVMGYLNWHLKNRELKSDIIFNNIQNNRTDRVQLTVAGANQIIKKICNEAGIKRNITTHVFRHTAAVAWLNAGVNTKKIMTMMGLSQESSLEAYFKRDRRLIKVFEYDQAILRKIPVSNKQKEFEKMMMNVF